MKKLYLLLTGMFILMVALNAQIKMTAKTHGFRTGDSHPFVFANGIDEGQSGQNVIWDFTTLEKISKTLTSHMLNPDTVADANKVGNSNLVLEEFGNKFLFNSNENGMYQYGSISCNTITKYDKPFVKLKFPFTYGNKVAGDYSGSVTGTNYNVNVSGKYEIFADAYGTLLLPGNISVENALRIKQTRTIAYENSNSEMTEITYRWYIKDVRYPIIVMVKYVSDKSSSIAETAVYANIENTKFKKGVDKVAVQDLALNVYPNPYDQDLKVSYNLEKASKVKIEIIDINGKLFKTILQGKQEAGSHELNISSVENNMKDGTYYLKFTNGDQSHTRKIVKQ